jgi:hypothetical protein
MDEIGILPQRISPPWSEQPPKMMKAPGAAELLE